MGTRAEAASGVRAYSLPREIAYLGRNKSKLRIRHTLKPHAELRTEEGG
jgi:hypothetical protein